MPQVQTTDASTRSATYVHALNTIIELTKDRDRYRDIAGRLAEAGRECISSVQEIDSRLDYVDCQLDRKDWQDMQAALAEYEAMESKWTVTQVNPIDGPAVEKEAKIP